MSEVKKIAVYGDSLALPRKGIVKYNERYFFLISKWIKENFSVDYIEYKDRATGAATITDIFKIYEHDERYFELPADIVVFQFGIVDCAPRPINDITRNKINRLPKWIKKLAINYLHNNRRKILQKGNFYVKTNKELFSSTLNKLLKKAVVDYKSVYIINICPTNNKTENHSPGLTNNIIEYNKIISEFTAQLSQSNLHLIDVYNFINQRKEAIDNYVVAHDGHHITSLTHKFIADTIIEHQKAMIK